MTISSHTGDIEASIWEQRFSYSKNGTNIAEGE